MSANTAAAPEVSGNHADRVIQTVINDVIGAIRIGRRVKRQVPTSVLAAALQDAAEEYDRSNT